MMLESQVPQDSLVTITVDKVGLVTMISAAHKAIKQTNEWNLGDEYDTCLLYTSPSPRDRG